MRDTVGDQFVLINYQQLLPSIAIYGYSKIRWMNIILFPIGNGELGQIRIY